jgi:hypothetical protein
MDRNPYQAPQAAPQPKRSDLLWLRVVNIACWVLLFILVMLRSTYVAWVRGIQPYYLVIFALLLIVMTFGRRVFEKTRGRKRPAWMQGYNKQLESSFDEGKAFGGDQPPESRPSDENQIPD